jgi:hypothetical protein
MDAGKVTALPTALPAGSRIVEVTRALCAPLPWFSTSVRIWTVAAPACTWVRANVPHFFTCTGLVFTSQTCR